MQTTKGRTNIWPANSHDTFKMAGWSHIVSAIAATRHYYGWGMSVHHVCMIRLIYARAGLLLYSHTYIRLVNSRRKLSQSFSVLLQLGLMNRRLSNFLWFHGLMWPGLWFKIYISCQETAEHVTGLGRLGLYISLTMTLFAIILYGQCCWRHVVGQEIVSNISVDGSF